LYQQDDNHVLTFGSILAQTFLKAGLFCNSGQKIYENKMVQLTKMSKDSNEKFNKTLSKKYFFGVNLVTPYYTDGKKS
jgi:hypothetical protein